DQYRLHQAHVRVAGPACFALAAVHRDVDQAPFAVQPVAGLPDDTEDLVAGRVLGTLDPELRIGAAQGRPPDAQPDLSGSGRRWRQISDGYSPFAVKYRSFHPVLLTVYPFTAPSASPDTSRRCTMNARTSGGSAI